MIAILVAAALASAPAHGGPTPNPPAGSGLDAYTTQEVAYAKTALSLSGWGLVSATRDLLIFSRPYAGSAPDAPKVWVRGEHYPLSPINPLGSGESFVSVYQLDCGAHRDRTTNSTIYSGANLQGSILGASDEPGKWEQTQADGFMGLIADSICPKAPSSGAAKNLSEAAPKTPKP